jgi:hypothetical protein
MRMGSFLSSTDVSFLQTGSAGSCTYALRVIQMDLSGAGCIV